jgi:thiamine-monophosphate kinase
VQLDKVPVASSARRIALATGNDATAWATSGGEDYELLLTCERDALAGLARGLRDATGTALTAVGEIVGADSDVTFVDADGVGIAVAPGFEHFVTGAGRE